MADVLYDKKGHIINSLLLSSTSFDEDIVNKAVASIDEDWVITIAQGMKSTSVDSYDALDSDFYQVELLPDGKLKERNW